MPLLGIPLPRQGSVADTDIHVVFRQGRWQVVIEGLDRVASEHERLDDAIAAGQEAALPDAALRVSRDNNCGSLAACLCGCRWAFELKYDGFRAIVRRRMGCRCGADVAGT